MQVRIVQSGRSLNIKYQSLGESSDRLLAAIAQLYKLQPPSKKFRKDVSANLVVLDANSDEMANKVFFSANGPRARYAELYTNINKKKGLLEIHEKDQEYRSNVLKALTE